MKEYYCKKCHKYRIMEYVGKKDMYDGASRLMIGLVSCGISELANASLADRYYKCSECGTLRKG
jgi:hypothetical protein